MKMDFIIVFISTVFELLSLAILGRVLFSWLSPQQRSGRFYAMLVEVTEPVLAVFKRYIPPIGMIDISPLVALIVLDFVRRLLISLII